MARSNFAMADDWSWRELLGTELLLSPRALTPLAAVTSASTTTTPPFLAPNSTGSSTIHPSDRSRGVPATSPPSLDDLVWQWDGDEVAMLNVDIDTLCDPVGLGTSLHEQDEAPANTQSGTHLAKKTKTAKVSSAPVKRSRMRRKVEIALLRDESQKLQQKLVQLREYWKQAPARAATDSKHRKLQKTLDLVANTEPLWKQIALRQRDAAVESEKQNNALKAKYQEQRKMLRTLRTLLIKRVAMMKSTRR
uniref:Uncharacterized protein n=1 Tax=Globisporangium ultimum (strain ATCC 200006 / CBS 805.95 / DAOM BR144) TaxID=431595 RepID=K3W8Y8_GLOUD